MLATILIVRDFGILPGCNLGFCSSSYRDVQRQYVILVAAVEAVEAVNLKSP